MNISNGANGGMLRQSLSLTLIAMFALLLSGCGFQLRGQTTLPFETLYVPTSSALTVELKRNIAAGTQTKLVSTPAYMLAQSISEAASGINKLVDRVLELTHENDA